MPGCGALAVDAKIVVVGVKDVKTSEVAQSVEDPDRVIEVLEGIRELRFGDHDFLFRRIGSVGRLFKGTP